METLGRISGAARNSLSFVSILEITAPQSISDPVAASVRTAITGKNFSGFAFFDEKVPGGAVHRTSRRKLPWAVDGASAAHRDDHIHAVFPAEFCPSSTLVCRGSGSTPESSTHSMPFSRNPFVIVSRGRFRMLRGHRPAGPCFRIPSPPPAFSICPFAKNTPLSRCHT